MLVSAGAQALFDSLTRRAPNERMQARIGVPALGPSIVKLDDPRRDAEEAVAALDEATPAGRARNRWLQRQKKKWEGLVRQDDGTTSYDGRACCGALITKINAGLHVIAIPSDYVCECGAAYRVQYLPREERRHE